VLRSGSRKELHHFAGAGYKFDQRQLLKMSQTVAFSLFLFTYLKISIIKNLKKSVEALYCNSFFSCLPICTVYCSRVGAGSAGVISKFYPEPELHINNAAQQHWPSSKEQ
jgi:hypothetical protein